ncbi:PREDICTED: uncharacterized protein LOC107188846 isoform X2 [Dufourea novaeangliae]|uniref:uncharacterized protein LOC107188846 isoform X2 n=1 Tax=Dufourea novaeangliae TaxID=178035 RepID=UPI000767136C|nr:PREDICTED: uncharacterized protein LOC107188846 isoform X2 [Dufourea novaeangliae]
MSKATRTKSGKRNAETQTQNNLEMTRLTLEIQRLQDQVKLLTIENNRLKQYNAEEPSPVLKITSTRSQKTPSTVNKNDKASTRGCTCKGNCSSKICGCVKRDTICGELCKCNNSHCQNQDKNDSEQNKENLENIESPYMQVEEQYRPTPLYFGGAKMLTFRSDEEEEEESKDTRVKRMFVKNDAKYQNDSNTVTQRRGRSKKKNLEVDSTSTKKYRSISNEEKKWQTEVATEMHTLRRSNSNEIEVPLDKLEDQEKSINHMVSLKRGNKKKGLHSAKQTKKTDNASRDTEDKKVTSADDDKNEKSQNSSTEISGPLNRRRTHTLTPRKHNESEEILKEDFDPMKPKHELPRTPTTGNSDTSSRSTPEVLQLMPIVTMKEECPVPEELNQSEVNWEEYQSQLVACKKCKRKFHPLRIKKHQACCKKL